MDDSATATSASLRAGEVAAILPAGGSGRRFGAAQNKLLAELGGKPLWLHAAERLAAREEVGRLIVPLSPADRETFAERSAEAIARLRIEFVDGGAERVDSVRSGLAALAGDAQTRYVAVHDAARPLVHDEDLSAVFNAAVRSGAAILATPVVGTLKRDLGERRRCVTVDRNDLWVALTPQVFRIDWFRTAYERYRGWPVTDDAQLVERAGYSVSLVPGRADNLKITYPEDLAIAEALLAQQSQDARSA